MFGAACISLSVFGVGQTTVQRYCALPTLRQAKQYVHTPAEQLRCHCVCLCLQLTLLDLILNYLILIDYLILIHCLIVTYLTFGDLFPTSPLISLLCHLLHFHALITLSQSTSSCFSYTFLTSPFFALSYLYLRSASEVVLRSRRIYRPLQGISGAHATDCFGTHENKKTRKLLQNKLISAKQCKALLTFASEIVNNSKPKPKKVNVF